MRIYYLAHDAERPTGGMRMIYAHVAALRRHGFDASVVQERSDYRPSWFDADVPILYGDQKLAVGPGDVVAVPETYGKGLAWAAKRKARPIVFCQNHFYAAVMLEEIGDWRQWGCETVLCSSQPIADFVRSLLGFRDPAVVPCAVDAAAFPPRPKTLAVACMPQKRPVEAALIRLLLRRRFPRHDDVPFRSLRGVGQEALATALGEAAVFLSLARHEGLGLAALEAMAAEAVVVGFHGEGGRDYATSANGNWVEEGEVDRCVDRLAETLDLVKAGAPTIAATRASGRATVARYSQSAMETALVGFWQGMAAQSSPASPRT